LQSLQSAEWFSTENVSWTPSVVVLMTDVKKGWISQEYPPLPTVLICRTHKIPHSGVISGV
jgi:hypothetical protein